MTSLQLSIIIPVLNEATLIGALLADLRSRTQSEIIVVDGGSQDETVAIAQAIGVNVLTTTGGRGAQLNLGASVATGNVLLFLHVDTQLPPNFEAEIEQILHPGFGPSPIAGAFKLGIDHPLWSFRIIEWGANLRSRMFQRPYGDQALFIPKPLFKEIGGFSEWPIMEDFELVGRVCKLGRIALTPSAVQTSPRRWLKRGILATTLINQVMVLGYRLGVAPRTLRNWYHQPPRPTGTPPKRG
jgi:rSAM/selenodomain-associated transferase 2